MASSITVWANPAPFGLEIGTTSIKELKAKYSVTQTGINKYSGGEMFKLNPSQLNFDGLKEATVIFDSNKKVTGILITLPKHRFDAVRKSLSSKYRVTKQQIPFVGNKSVTYSNNETEITLEAPHLSFDMSLNYISNTFLKKFNAQTQREAQQKRESEQSQL